ncbi:DUF5996 family protein [Flammeovirga aprica]|uniref:Ava_C0101 and related proteins n=1 Tax=Flammeovirga aprica JL-4 TaxID=694437 RepID=A0A7X9RYU5_9BACT|nr:DUF5996 family protein [Flammeovirga aprica]NME71312.1 hypothetical protein [Flammeovirga aprica JL-4]
MTPQKTISPWPELNFSDMKETLATLHQWIQIVGKIRLKTMPWQNHSWHVTLYISPTGFTTQGIPYQGRFFQIDFDFEKHQLLLSSTGKTTQIIPLKHMTVADFYNSVFEKLNNIDVDVTIHGSPNEMEPAIPFKENTTNKTYEPEQAEKIWQSLLKANCLFQQFRSEYIGKCSPVHLFWGAFDLAVTRFSGSDAPLHQGGMPNMPLEVMQEAYSKEVSSAGFWLGSEDFPVPSFYAYAYPVAPDFGTQKVAPAQAFYSEEMGEFFLKYEDVQQAEDPDGMLLSFLQSTYEAAANTSKWDRGSLER